MNMQGIQIIDPMINMRSSFRKYKLKHKFEIWQVYLTENIVYTSFKRGTGAWEISKNNEIHVNQEADIDVN